MQHLKHKQQSGFTLLELLVVVGILAVIGGSVIANMDGQEAKAARGGATHTLAALEDSIRIFNVTQGVLPDNFDALACVDVITATNLDGTEIHPAVAAASIYGGVSNLPGVGGGLGAKVAGKFTMVELETNLGQAMINAGITKVRYGEIDSCDDDDATPAVAKGDFPQGALSKTDIPNRGFDVPTTGKNRGRGFARTIADGTDNTAIVLTWNPGTGGVNNTKLGAGADDVLVGLGIGNNASIVGTSGGNMSQAPFYGQVAKDKYSRYIALINVGADTTGAAPHGDAAHTAAVTAKEVGVLQAIIDARGDFLDEEFAEFTGQKG